MSSIFPCVTQMLKGFFIDLPRAVKKPRECALEVQSMCVCFESGSGFGGG